MAVTTSPFTNADFVATIPEIWTPIVNEPNYAKAVLSNFVTDLSPYMAEGGDIAHVPNIYTNVFTASTQSTQGAEIDTQGPAQVDTTLTVSTHQYVSWIIGDLTMKQLATKYQLNEAYAREAQNVLITALEGALAALWSSLTTNVVGDTATVLTDLEIRTAINALDSTNYALADCAFFFHPTVYWAQVGGISKYYDFQISQMNFIRTGNFGPMDASRGLRGHIYDIPVFVTSNIVSGLQTYRNLLLHKSALGFAIQTMSPASVPGGQFSQDMGASKSYIRVQSNYELRNIGTLVVCDIIYGVGVLREPGGVVIRANTTATTA